MPIMMDGFAVPAMNSYTEASTMVSKEFIPFPRSSFKDFAVKDSIDDDHEDHHHCCNSMRLSTGISNNGKSSIYSDDLDTSQLSADDYVDADVRSPENGKHCNDSDEKKDVKVRGGNRGVCLSLPSTPRCSSFSIHGDRLKSKKDYFSDHEIDEIQFCKWKSRRLKEINFERSWDIKNKRSMEGKNQKKLNEIGECVVVTKPVGGEKCLCMDLDEVKACRDLGFELQDDLTVSISGGFYYRTCQNCTNQHFTISSPGDDPEDVKARLKIWAQAVALVSTSTTSLDH